MVEKLRDYYKIGDERVLEAMNRVPRHLFVPDALRSQAYKDNALPIAGGQTISQPFIVARMTELLQLRGDERLLEIGAGSGYQTAVLSNLARRVYSVERLATLAAELKKKVVAFGLRNVSVRCDDGTTGWPIYSPYDAILVAAGGPEVPEPLVEQLAVGGRLVVPVGNTQRSQVLIRITRTETGLDREECGSCVFVPLIGEHGWKAQKTNGN